MSPRLTRPARGAVARLTLVAIAVVAAVAPLPQALVERWYSRGLYAALQPIVTSASNLVPVALLDLAIAGVILMFVRRFRRRARGARAAVLIRDALVALATLSAAAYLAFLALWGLNYRRVPLAEKLDYSRDRVTADAAVSLARIAVAEVNRTHGDAHAAAQGPHLESSFADAQRILGARRTAAVGVPKRSLLAFYFRWAAIDGMTDPFFLEIILNPDVLAVERPFVTAHEWAHLAGYANESEASFVAWLACVRGDARSRYSGWLALFGHVSGTLTRDERADVYARLDAGPRQDLADIRARVLRSAPAVRHVARDVYDAYLKANRVREGIASYDEVVTLVLGSSFEKDWAPRLRATSSSAAGLHGIETIEFGRRHGLGRAADAQIVGVRFRSCEVRDELPPPAVAARMTAVRVEPGDRMP